MPIALIVNAARRVRRRRLQRRKDAKNKAQKPTDKAQQGSAMPQAPSASSPGRTTAATCPRGVSFVGPNMCSDLKSHAKERCDLSERFPRIAETYAWAAEHCHRHCHTASQASQQPPAVPAA